MSFTERRLPSFGRYLRQLREAKGERDTRFTTQGGAAAQLGKSQSFVAQYEGGRIIDPDPQILRQMAECYDAEYLEMIWQLVREKYIGKNSDKLNEHQIAVWQSALRRFPKVWGESAFEYDQLRAKAVFVAEAEVMDMRGMARWCRNQKDLQQLWIVVPDFIDDQDRAIYESVVHNLKRGVRYAYFVREEDRKPAGRFWIVEQKLLKDVGQECIDRLLTSVPLTRSEVTWLNKGYVIANPLVSGKSVATELLHLANNRHVALRMPDTDAYALSMRLQTWLREQDTKMVMRLAPAG